jgi:rod shape-determining protein MreD
MTRYALYLIAAAAALVLEITWLTWLTRLDLGAPADLLLVVVMTVGLLHGPEEGAIAGAACGLLEDVMTGVPLGLGMLGGVAVGFCAGLAEQSIYVENMWLPAIAACALTLVRYAVWAGAAQLAGLLHAPPMQVARVAALAACYNGCIAIPIFHGLRRLDGALVRVHEGSPPP